MNCKKCGNSINDNTQRCTNCGCEFKMESTTAKNGSTTEQQNKESDFNIKKYLNELNRETRQENTAKANPSHVSRPDEFKQPSYNYVTEHYYSHYDAEYAEREYSCFGWEIESKSEQVTTHEEKNYYGQVLRTWNDVNITTVYRVNTSRPNNEKIGECYRNYCTAKYQLQSRTYRNSTLSGKVYALIIILSVLFIGIPLGIYVASLMNGVSMSSDEFSINGTHIFLAIAMSIGVAVWSCGIAWGIHKVVKDRKYASDIKHYRNVMAEAKSEARRYL